MEEYEIVTKSFLDNIQEIESLVHRSKYPYTAKALYRFSLKVDIISQGIGELVKTDNLYHIYHKIVA